MATSAELLDRLYGLWILTRRDYRDGLLECGRLAHQYAAAVVADGKASGRTRRRERKLVRCHAIATCAEKLGIPERSVNRLVAASMAVDLLSDGGNVGALSWTTILWFARLIRRKPKAAHHEIGEEVWELRPEYGDAPIAHFRKAVEIGLLFKDAGEYVRRLDLDAGRTTRQSKNPQSKKGRVREARRPVADPTAIVSEAVASMASPRDLAEQLFPAVHASPDPEAVVRHLGEMVRQAAKDKREWKGPPCDDETGPGRNARAGDPVRTMRKKHGMVNV